MLEFPAIDPIAIAIGPLAIRWYGLSYLTGLLGAWWLLRRRAADQRIALNASMVDDVIFYATLGIVLGGRLGSVFFYQTEEFLKDPLMLFRIWEGGMSFHGGLAGVIVAMGVFARRYQLGFFDIADAVAPVVPIGLGLGRLANFINGELWGRVTDVPWAMVFPGAGPLPRHPSQLYQAFLEGLVLFIILTWFIRRPRPAMSVSGLFLLCYGLFRFAVEFVREPDAQLGFLWGGWLTMGQLLCVPMLLAGAALLLLARWSRGSR